MIVPGPNSSLPTPRLPGNHEQARRAVTLSPSIAVTWLLLGVAAIPEILGTNRVESASWACQPIRGFTKPPRSVSFCGFACTRRELSGDSSAYGKGSGVGKQREITRERGRLNVQRWTYGKVTLSAAVYTCWYRSAQI